MAGQPHALVSWKIAKVCDRAVDELDTLNAMMTRERRPRERVLEKNRRKEARAWLRAAHEEERDRAASRGTAVHKAAEDGVAPEDVTDYEDPESGAIIAADEIRPKLRQYLAWLRASQAPRSCSRSDRSGTSSSATPAPSTCSAGSPTASSGSSTSRPDPTPTVIMSSNRSPT